MKQIDEILEILNNINALEDINSIYNILKMPPITIEGFTDITENEEFFEYLSKELIENIEKTLDSEELNYFYNKLNTYYIPFIANENKKIDFLKTKTLPEYKKLEIITSLSQDENKVECLDILSKEGNKKIVILSLDEDIKIQCLDKLSLDEFYIVDVIKSLSKKGIETILNDSRYSKYSEIAQIFKTKYDLKEGKIIIEQDEKNLKYSSLGLPEDMTIGIEIEGEAKKYTREIVKNILKKNSDKLCGYDIKSEHSIENGLELSSPIMKDSKENINSVYYITQIMKNLGFTTSKRCGGHVHIGANSLKSVDALKELLEIWGNTEEILYLISNRPKELPRQGVTEFAPPISQEFNNQKLRESKDDKFVQEAKDVQGTRNYGINLLNINEELNTIEFRTSNGTLNPNVWIENIRLYGRLVQVANELGEIKVRLKVGQMPTEEEKKKIQMKLFLKKDLPVDVKMEVLMKLLFDEEEQKVYRERYIANKELAKERGVMDDLHFAKNVELKTKGFVVQYYSDEEPER